jgi:hypothetical protein
LRKFIIIAILLIYASLSAFQSGEKLTFKIKYGFITGGSAVLEVNDYIYNDSLQCYKITSVAKTGSVLDKVYKVRDKIESVMDTSGEYSYRFKKNLREGSYRQKRTHYFYPNQGLTIFMNYKRKQKIWKEKRFDIPQQTHDVLSAFYWARMQDLQVGKTEEVNVTVDGGSHIAKVVVHRKETIKTIFGKKECLVIEPLLKGEALFKQTGHILIWVTNDEYKIPVKLQSKVIFGSFKAILKKAENVPY